MRKKAKFDPKRKVPVFSNEQVLAGIFEVSGKVIVYSFIQNGPGFPPPPPSYLRIHRKSTNGMTEIVSFGYI